MPISVNRKGKTHGIGLPRRKEKANCAIAFTFVRIVKLSERLRYGTAKARRSLTRVSLVAISKKICCQKRVVQQALQNDILIRGLAQVIEPSDSSRTTYALH